MPEPTILQATISRLFKLPSHRSLARRSWLIGRASSEHDTGKERGTAVSTAAGSDKHPVEAT